MINVVTDLIQSCSIIFLTIMWFLLSRRVNRLNTSERQIIYQQWPSASLKAPPAEEPKAICGCEHHQCFHDENGCNKEETWSRMGDERYSQLCGCKRYTGPEQLPQVIP